MSPASYQTAPPRNVWTHLVRKKEYYDARTTYARRNPVCSDISTIRGFLSTINASPMSHSTHNGKLEVYN